MSINSPLFYVVEVDAYKPAGGSAGIPQLPWGAAPWGAEAMLPYSLESYSTILASDRGYRTAPADGPVVVYPPVLDSAFAIDRRLNLDPGQPAAAAGWGTLNLVNTDNRFDTLAAVQNSDGRGIRIYVGTKGYDPARGYFTDPSFTTLTQLFTGIGQNWFCSDTVLAVPIRDATYWLERPVQSTLYGGSGGLDGGTDLTGQPKPRARGLVRNIAPVLVDATNRIYQWNDGPVQGVGLMFEGGATTITFQSDVSDLYSGSTNPGQYRTNNARGLFQLGSAPVHQITIDGTASLTVSMVGNTATDLAKGLLLDDLGLDPDYVDTASFGLGFILTGGAPDEHHMPAGYYLTDAIQGADLLGQIVGSIGAKVFPKRDGTLSLFILRALGSGATPAATFSRANAVSLTPTQLNAPLDPPPYRFQVGYAHNYTVQNTDLGGSITDSQKQFASVADRFSVSVSGSVLTAYRRPSDPPALVTFLNLQAHATAVAGHLTALWSTRRRLYNLVLPVSLGIQREIGDVVSLMWPMDDLAGGKLGQVVGEQFRGGDSTITLQVLV